MDNSEYKLSCVLYGHSLDVRCIDVREDNCILSGSRDKTAKFWRPNEFNAGYTDSMTSCKHKNYVSSVCFLDGTPEFLNGLFITGGNDHTISVFNSDNFELITSFKGHNNTVCSLARVCASGKFLSSSWDCTAKLWSFSDSTVKELVVFSGHQAAVWSCVQLPNGNVATASADKDVIIWSEDGKKINILKGHTDCVRGLAVLNDQVFLSTGNDASVKEWTMDGKCLNTLYGHGNYIYSISVNRRSQNTFVTAGEDRAVKIWKDNKDVQTLTLPAQSIWCVQYLSNGDVVTGCSDGVIRIFTQDPARVAEEDVLKIFEEEVNNLKVASSQEIGGVKISDLPGREILYEPGKRDGQTKLVREGASVMCYSWSAAEGTWNKVGDVMGASGGTQATSGKTLYEGKEYDFVFTVDIEDGKPPIKLPYNKDQDPWFAAQEFIHKNNLPQAYLEQVANFIVQNSGMSQNAPVQSTDYVDPFTGGSRYMPGSSVTSDSVSGSNLDPFTGSQSYTTQAAAPKHDSNVAYFPHKAYLKFEQGNVQVILDKMKELNRKPGNTYTMDEILLEEVVRLADGTSVDSLYIDALMQLLNWPTDIVFPVLDITRLAIRHSENNCNLCSQVNGEFLIQMIRRHLSEPNIANKMLSLRILCNMFSHAQGELLILNHRNGLLSDITKFADNINKNCQIALATFLLNLSVALLKTKNLSDTGGLVETIIETILKVNDPEAEFRSYVALGTLLSQLEPVNIIRIVGDVSTLPRLKEKLCEVSNQYSSDSNELRNITCASKLNSLLL